MLTCRYMRYILFIMVICFPGGGFIQQAEADPIERWTGKHSRLVWLQDQGDGSDALANRHDLMLFGYDSRDGKGERPLLPGAGHYFKPLLTPDGRQVIFSNRTTRQMYMFDWQSGKVEELGSGIAVAVWQDPKPSLILRQHTTWVYCFSGAQPENKYGTSQPLYRFSLDKPKKKELIWDKTNLAWDNIQLSRDGAVVGGLFPWPDGGVLWTKDKRWQRLGNGCWTSLSPDNSKLLWIFDGLHRNIEVYDVARGQNWQVNINNAPGIGGFEVYHPRWSNHPRYFVVTGPYEKGEGGNRIGGGGEKVEIYIGRFDEKVKRVEDWLKVTNNSRADFFPDLWIEGGNRVQLAEAPTKEAGAAVAKAPEWPVSPQNLVFVWDNMKAANQLSEKSPIGFLQCNIELRGRALFTRQLQLATAGGFAETGEAGKKIGPILAKTGRASLETVVEPKALQKGALISFAAGDTQQLIIAQDGGDLLVGKGTEILPLRWTGVFTNDTPMHLLLGVDGKNIEVFAGGKSLGKKEGREPFLAPGIDALRFGDQSGKVAAVFSGIAIYNEILTPREILASSQIAGKRSATKPGQPPLILMAKLAATTEIPAPDAIGAYRRALVVNSYAIDKVLQGEYAQNRILVAEWAILDREIIKKYQQPVSQEQLVLEKFNDHPELEGERQMMDVFEPELEMYYRLLQPTGS